MVDHIVEASGPRGRVEIRSGVGRRRRWSDAEKGRIVAESFAAGAVVSACMLDWPSRSGAAGDFLILMIPHKTEALG